MEAIFQAAASVIASITTGVTANAVYEYLKSNLGGREITHSEFEKAISDFLVLHEISATAETVMSLLAEKGMLRVTGSSLHGKEAFELRASGDGVFLVGDNTTMSTDRTAVRAGSGAFVSGKNAAVKQNPDGSVSFAVAPGEGNGLAFSTRKK